MWCRITLRYNYAGNNAGSEVDVKEKDQNDDVCLFRGLQLSRNETKASIKNDSLENWTLLNKKKCGLQKPPPGLWLSPYVTS